MSAEHVEPCPECDGEGTVIHPFLQSAYLGSHAINPPDDVRVECDKCDGRGEITDDDHDAFAYPYGTTISLRGEKRIAFYEHEGDHVIIWWLPGDEATHGPADATQTEQSEIYGQLWAEMEDRWASAAEDW